MAICSVAGKAGRGIDLSFEESVQYLYGLQKHGAKLGLSNTLALMELLDDPHTRFKSVHIAGTNGKGSTAAMLASILEKAGYRVGLYTSPHLVSFTERIRVNGEAMPEEKVVELTKNLRARIETLPEPFIPTFFEFTTALAFAYFVESGVEVAVVETGMGGRLDSTNVITPLASVITTVDIDHQEFLGEGIEDIAAEKAGIIKTGVPVVTGRQDSKALRVIKASGYANQAPLYSVGRDASIFSMDTWVGGSVFSYHGFDGVRRPMRISLIGRHQVENAALALLTVDVLRRRGLVISVEAAQDGLSSARWPGRLEKVAENPLILLDGAHNPGSAARLAETIKGIFAGHYERLILLLGILADKDMAGIIGCLAPLADMVIVTRPNYYRAGSTARIRKVVKAYTANVQEAQSVPDAIDMARAAASEKDMICITGSLFTVGEAKGYFADEPACAGSGLAVLKG